MRERNNKTPALLTANDALSSGVSFTLNLKPQYERPSEEDRIFQMLYQNVLQQPSALRATKRRSLRARRASLRQVSAGRSLSSSQPTQSRIAQAAAKVIEQARQADAYNARSSYNEEVIAEEEFEYPQDRIISISKGRKLNRRV